MAVVRNKNTMWYGCPNGFWGSNTLIHGLPLWSTWEKLSHLQYLVVKDSIPAQYWQSVHHLTLITYHCCQFFSGQIQFLLCQLQIWLIFCHGCFSLPVCLHGHFTNTLPIVTLTSAHTLANIIIDVYWDHWEWSVSISYILHGPGDPARVDQTLACVPVALTLHCSLPLIHNHLEDLSAVSEALLMALPLSGPLSQRSRLRSFLNFYRPVSISFIWNLNTDHKLFSWWAYQKPSELGLAMSKPMGHILSSFILNLMTFCKLFVN